MSPIGPRITEARKRLGYSQEELARASALTARSVWRIEHGKAAPSIASLGRIASALRVEPSWLLGGADGGPRSGEAA
jgi:transcriptional regulator with XRE-family HTH domain